MPADHAGTPSEPDRGLRVRVDYADDWCDLDWRERDAHRAELIRDYTAKFEPFGHVTARGLAAALWISREAIYRSLKLALEKRWIERRGTGRYVHYRTH